MSRGSTWTNSDGLKVGFGKHTADNDTPAVISSNSGRKVMVVEINGADLVDTFAATNVKPGSPTIKRGSSILSATLMVSEVFVSGGGGTLDIGLWGLNAGVVDVADGIDADIAVAAINGIGEIVHCDGALVNGTVPAGATANDDCVIAPSYETAVFTAGRGTLTIEYIEPLFDSSIAA